MAQTQNTVSYSAKNKAKARRSRKNAGYYARHRDVAVINKLIGVATHVTRYADRKTLDRLKQAPAIDKHRALQHAKLRGNKKAIEALNLAG